MSELMRKEIGAGKALQTYPMGDRLALRVKEAAAALGVSERKLREVLPELPHFHLGGVVLLPVEPLLEWLRDQARTEPAKVDQAVEEVITSFKKDLQPGD